MEKKNIDVDKISEKFSSLSEEFYWILDYLPFGITVQLADYTIIYENKAIKEMLGSHLGKKCYSRWTFIPGWGKAPCSDCPLFMVKSDKVSHNIYRAFKKDNNTEYIFKIHQIPILDEDGSVTKFIELVFNATHEPKAKILSKVHPLEIISEIKFAIVRFGVKGGEVLISEKLYFLEKTTNQDIFLSRLAVYIFTGLMQGRKYNYGLYGPFPVLDYSDMVVLIYSFSLPSFEQKDPRLKGADIGLLLMFIPRRYKHLFEQFQNIEDLVGQIIGKLVSIEEVRMRYNEIFSKIKEVLLSIIQKQIKGLEL